VREISSDFGTGQLQLRGRSGLYSPREKKSSLGQSRATQHRDEQETGQPGARPGRPGCPEAAPGMLGCMPSYPAIAPSMPGCMATWPALGLVLLDSMPSFTALLNRHFSRNNYTSLHFLV
jgi:hypothetical protein